jgi:hypothetical protein
MRKVQTRPPSFSPVAPNQLLERPPLSRWQVLCGDQGHWRAGIYAPGETSAAQCQELERHDCPEFFLLLHGRLTVVINEEGAVREVPLEPQRPILITAPHSGFCPDGPHTGQALVIERDSFDTEYRSKTEWS